MERNPSPIRALLVDDHALFRESVARVLTQESLLEIEHCASIREALELLAQRPFDLVLLDHDLGNERASQFLPAARQIGFEGRVLVVTAWVSDTEARRLLRQGVAGIFLKQGPLKELSQAIRTVASGGTWLDSSFTHVEGEAAAAGHADIRHQDIRRIGAQCRQRVVGAIEAFGEHAAAFQRLLEHPADGCIVVD